MIPPNRSALTLILATGCFSDPTGSERTSLTDATTITGSSTHVSTVGMTTGGDGLVDSTGSTTGFIEPLPTTTGNATTTGSDTSSDAETAEMSTGSIPVQCGDGIVAPGELCLVEAVTWTVGLGPTAVAVADINLDGHSDIIASLQLEDRLAIRFGAGDGTFDLIDVYQVGADPHAVIAVDLNGDAAPEIVTANQNSHDLSVLLNDGAGTMIPQPAVVAGMGPSTLAFGDADGELGTDVFVANLAGDTVGVYLGTGTGLAVSAPYPAGDGCFWVAVGDVNRDTKLDIVALNVYDQDIGVLLGDGSGGFGALTKFPVDGAAYALALADLNGDGNIDAVATVQQTMIHVLLGNSKGEFGKGGSGLQKLILAQRELLKTQPFAQEAAKAWEEQTKASNNLLLLVAPQPAHLEVPQAQQRPMAEPQE